MDEVHEDMVVNTDEEGMSLLYVYWPLKASAVPKWPATFWTPPSRIVKVLPLPLRSGYVAAAGWPTVPPAKL